MTPYRASLQAPHSGEYLPVIAGLVPFGQARRFVVTGLEGRFQQWAVTGQEAVEVLAETPTELTIRTYGTWEAQETGIARGEWAISLTSLYRTGARVVSLIA